MLARKALLIFLVNLAGALLGVVASFFIGHYMGPVPLGMWATALALVGIVGFLGDFGLSYAHRKKISEHGADLGRSVGTFLLLRNVALAGMVALVGTALLVWLVLLGKDFTDATTVQIVLLALIHQVLVLLVIVPKDTFYGLGRVAQAEAVNLVEHLVRVPLMVGAALLYASTRGRDVPFPGLFRRLAAALPMDGRYDASDGGVLLGAAAALAMGAALLAGLALFARHRYPVGRPSRGLARQYWALALPIGLLAGVSVLSTYFDTVMVSYFWGARDAGHYYSAQRISTLLLSISMALFTTLFPAFSQLASRADTAGLRDVFLEAERKIALVLAPLVAVNVVLAEPVMRLIFGAEFLPAAPILRILSLYVLLLSAVRPYHALLAGAGRPALLLRAGLVVNAANVLLNLLLIPRSVLGVPGAGLKGTGAALATLAATAIGLVYLRLQARPLADLSGAHRPHLRQIAAALGAGLAVWGPVHFEWVGEPVRIWEIALAGAVIGMLYAVLVALLKELRRQDVAFLGDVAHPFRMLRYVYEEVRWGRHGPR